MTLARANSHSSKRFWAIPFKLLHLHITILLHRQCLLLPLQHLLLQMPPLNFSNQRLRHLLHFHIILHARLCKNDRGVSSHLWLIKIGSGVVVDMVTLALVLALEDLVSSIRTR
ncbi:hypothetical protein DL96DRAFT_1651812 [Flagelloscypha sp. PMI_526]|nr:hypothetical protein DL96DRAFT_1651812 [Flagelloscypha sp. PMI_526]